MWGECTNDTKLWKLYHLKNTTYVLPFLLKQNYIKGPQVMKERVKMWKQARRVWTTHAHGKHMQNLNHIEKQKFTQFSKTIGDIKYQ